MAELAKNILTVTFSRWGKILKDDQMAAAMIDRIVHYGHLVVFEGPTKRMGGRRLWRGGNRRATGQGACRCRT